MNNRSNSSLHRQRGASAVEFVVVAPLLFMMGLGTLQAGLIYHGKTIVNYATFEAARVGATRHAMLEPMKKELGLRLAPLYGGDGTMAKAAEAMARSSVEVESPVNLDGTVAPATTVKVLNPSVESFDRWGRPSLEYKSRTSIPNSHLRHQSQTEGADEPGMTLADANLLKIQVTHGVELKIPFINKLIISSLMGLENISDPDPVKIAYYQAGRIPVTSTATVRMQSEAWKESIELSAAAPPFSNPVDPTLGLVPDDTGEADPPLNPLPDDGSQCTENGLDVLLRNPNAALPSCEAGPGGDDNGAASTC